MLSASENDLRLKNLIHYFNHRKTSRHHSGRCAGYDEYARKAV
jgi:hypothetical protein